MGKIKEKTPFDESNELIKKFMKENDLSLMHIEMFLSIEFDKVSVDREYYDTLEETEETKKLGYFQ